MKNKYFNYIKIFIIFIVITLLSGCWDYDEIEDRGVVLGIAIDKASPIPKGQDEKNEHSDEKKIETMELQVGEPKYAFTIHLPLMAKASNKPSGMSSGGGEKDPSWEMTVVSNSLFSANREFSTRLEYPPFYEHLQAIVISEDVAKEGIKEALDMILRDPEMRRRMKVFITPEEAKKIFDVQPRINDYSSMYLANLPDNANKTSRMLHLTDLGELSESLHSGTDFVLPRVISTKDEIKNAGSAVFKEGKMVGWLGEVGTIYLKWIRDAVLGGIITINSPYDKEGVIVLELQNAKTKINPVIDGDNIKFIIESKAKVNIAEESISSFQDSLDDNFIKAVEKEAEDLVKNYMIETVKYVQKEFEADIFHFNIALKRQKPHIWELVKDSWHEEFREVKVEPKIKVKVKLVGVVK